jgi:hypothetical protein
LAIISNTAMTLFDVNYVVLALTEQYMAVASSLDKTIGRGDGRGSVLYDNGADFKEETLLEDDESLVELHGSQRGKETLAESLISLSQDNNPHGISAHENANNTSTGNTTITANSSSTSPPSSTSTIHTRSTTATTTTTGGGGSSSKSSSSSTSTTSRPATHRSSRSSGTCPDPIELRKAAFSSLVSEVELAQVHKCGLPVSRSFLFHRLGMALVAEGPGLARATAGETVQAAVRGCPIAPAAAAPPVGSSSSGRKSGKSGDWSPSSSSSSLSSSSLMLEACQALTLWGRLIGPGGIVAVDVTPAHSDSPSSSSSSTSHHTGSNSNSSSSSSCVWSISYTVPSHFFSSSTTSSSSSSSSIAASSGNSSDHLSYKDGSSDGGGGDGGGGRRLLTPSQSADKDEEDKDEEEADSMFSSYYSLELLNTWYGGDVGPNTESCSEMKDSLWLPPPPPPPPPTIVAQGEGGKRREQGEGKGGGGGMPGLSFETASGDDVMTGGAAVAGSAAAGYGVGGGAGAKEIAEMEVGLVVVGGGGVVC